MTPTHVGGRHCGKIFIYALSTCVWCKKTKRFFNDLGLEYEYIDVDLLSEEDRDMAEQDIKKWGAAITFPTIILNNTRCIQGFDPDTLKKELNL